MVLCSKGLEREAAVRCSETREKSRRVGTAVRSRSGKSPREYRTVVGWQRPLTVTDSKADQGLEVAVETGGRSVETLRGGSALRTRVETNGEKE